MVNFVRQYEHLPLRALEITTNIGCKLNCRFCPQEAALKGYYKNSSVTPPAMLSFEDFKIIHSRLQRGGVLAFSGVSEPLANPDAVRMLHYACENGTKVSLASTLTSTSAKQLSLLAGVRFNNFIVHIPDAEQYAQFVITDDYLTTLTYALDTLPVTAFSCHGTIHPSVADIVSKKRVPINTNIYDRAGYLSDPCIARSQRQQGKIFCAGSYPHESHRLESFAQQIHSVRPDGSLVPCCMDFGMKHVLGNLLTQSWEEIKRGVPYQEFMKGFCEDTNTLCRTCSSAVPLEKFPSYRLHTLLRGTEEEKCTAFPQLSKTGVLQKMCNAPYIGIVGLGGVFARCYFSDLWDEAFQAVVFADNNKDLWNKPYRGTPLPSESGVVESPTALQQYPGIFVVTFVGNDEELGRQLDSMGIEHANIFKIFEMITRDC